MPENINTSSQKKSTKTHRRTTTRRKGVRLSTAQRAAAQETFLEAFAANGNVRVACLKANIDRSTVHQWQEHDETFNMRYHLAKEDVNDAIRAEIYRRAMFGEERFVTSMGKVVYHEDKPLTIREKSDTLLIFHAKARMPEYREKQQLEHTGKDGGPIEVSDVRQRLTQKINALRQSQAGARLSPTEE